MEFKDRIRELRIQRKLTLSQLAAAMDKSEGAIRSWETGRAKPDADSLVKLSDFFGCTTDFLLGISDAVTLSPENAATGYLYYLQTQRDSLNAEVDEISRRLYKLKEESTQLENYLVEKMDAIKLMDYRISELEKDIIRYSPPTEK